MCTKAPEFCSRKRTAQARLMLKEPLRCTASTSDQSDQLMRWKMRSRRMPALLTRMSTRPKAASAAPTISSAFFGSAMESVEAIASPPWRLISSTTSCAGPASVPAPSREAPMSHTTTRAPSLAISSAMPRPMPRPAPVTMATLPATMPVISVSPQRIACSLLSPHLVRHLHDRPQLRPLLILGERVAFLARGEAALRGEAKLVEIDELACLLDAPLDPILGFELAGLRRHQSQHHGLALAHAPQRLERAGAVGVVFHEITVHLDAVEQDVGHRVVAAAAHEGRTVVAAAQMHGDRHVGGDVRHRGIDQIGIALGELARVVTAPFLSLAVVGVAQHGDEHFVELQVAAACIGEGTHALAVGGAQLAEELLERRVGLLAHRGAAGAAVERRRRRDRDLGRSRRVRLDELEMLQHRVVGEAEFADDARALRPGLHTLERNALLHHVAFGAVEAPQEVEVPPGAAELAVGDRLEPDLLLLLDHALDLAILDRLERGRIYPALGVLLARLLQRCRTQQAADMVGAERRLGTLHVRPFVVVITVISSCHPRTIGDPCSRADDHGSPLTRGRHRVYGQITLAPHLFRHLHDPPQLRPLLLLGEDIAFLGRGEAALRREAELVERDELRRLLDAAFELVLRLKAAALGGDEAEHHHLAPGHEAQRLEAAGARAVVFHEIGVDGDLVEQDLGHRLVAAGGDEGGLKIAAAQMHRLGHAGGQIGERGGDHTGIDVRQLVRIVAAVGDEGAQLGIAQIGEVDLVELEIAAAGVGEGAQRLAVALAEVAVELGHVGIDRARHRVAPVAEMQRGGRRNGHLRRRLVRCRVGVGGDELEMIDHRMDAIAAELADDAQHHGLGLRALELDLALAEIGLDAVDPAEEVVVPEGAAKLAVGDRLEADVLLLTDDLRDLAVLDRLELLGGDLAALAPPARRFQGGGAQQAAHVIGAERRVGAGHDLAALSILSSPAQAGTHNHRPLEYGSPLARGRRQLGVGRVRYSAAASAAAAFCSTKSYLISKNGVATVSPVGALPGGRSTKSTISGSFTP